MVMVRKFSAWLSNFAAAGNGGWVRGDGLGIYGDAMCNHEDYCEIMKIIVKS